MEQKRGNLQQYGATFEMLLADVDDHYRTLRILERYLKNPEKLSTQLELQISPDQQNMLIEKLVSNNDIILTFSRLKIPITWLFMLTSPYLPCSSLHICDYWVIKLFIIACCKFRFPRMIVTNSKLFFANSLSYILIVFARYYEFDPAIVREILGKKLTSRYRNALDDISEKTKVPLRSCRRQVSFVSIPRIHLIC